MARTELPNGIILPAEYSDDWYDDMTSNLSKLDEVIGSDAEKLSDEDVGAAALSNDYTDLDNKPDLKPVATSGDYDDLSNKPDLKPVATSGDYDDLSNKPDLKPVATSGDYDDLTDLPNYGITRFCSSAISDNSSVAFSAISSTNKIKIGDFLLDTVGKMYQISAVDTANETVSVTTPLTQLAVDSDVVHKSGNETVPGSKTFTSPVAITSYPCIRMYLSDDEWNVQPATAKQSEIRFTDKNSVVVSYFSFQHRANSTEPFRTCWRQNKLDGTPNYYSVNFNNLGEFYPENNNAIDLGGSGNRWKSVYAINYYYGNDNVEFSTKFVTTDTAQTISETKTFTNTIKSQKEIEFTGNRLAYILPEFSASYSGLSLCTYSSSGAVRIGSWKVDDNDNTKHVLDTSLGYLNVTTGSVNSVNSVYLTPRNTTDSKLGDSTNKWKIINGVEPSSLSLPSGNLDDVIDISGYLTILDGSNENTYVAPANGWISILMNNCSSVQGYITGLWGHQIIRPSVGSVRFLMPVLKNQTANILILGGTIHNARFIPCQGNV